MFQAVTEQENHVCYKRQVGANGFLILSCQNQYKNIYNKFFILLIYLYHVTAVMVFKQPRGEKHGTTLYLNIYYPFPEETWPLLLAFCAKQSCAIKPLYCYSNFCLKLYSLCINKFLVQIRSSVLCSWIIMLREFHYLASMPRP